MNAYIKPLKSGDILVAKNTKTTVLILSNDTNRTTGKYVRFSETGIKTCRSYGIDFNFSQALWTKI